MAFVTSIPSSEKKSFSRVFAMFVATPINRLCAAIGQDRTPNMLGERKVGQSMDQLVRVPNQPIQHGKLLLEFHFLLGSTPIGDGPDGPRGSAKSGLTGESGTQKVHAIDRFTSHGTPLDLCTFSRRVWNESTQLPDLLAHSVWDLSRPHLVSLAVLSRRSSQTS